MFWRVSCDESDVIGVRDNFEIFFVVFSRSQVKETEKVMANDRKAKACRGRRVGRRAGRRVCSIK